MAIYLTAWGSVEVDELVHKILAGLLPATSITLEIGEAESGDGAVGYLCLEKIYLVEEEDKGGVLKPVGVGN